MAGEKSATYSNEILALLFNATAIANIADNAATSPLTDLYVALHTADPTASGTQSSNEVTYTGYARLAVARTSSGWAVSGAAVTPVSSLIFASPSGAAGQVATYWSIGVASTGATTFLYAGPITPSITITVGLPPTLTTASTVTES